MSEPRVDPVGSDSQVESRSEEKAGAEPRQPAATKVVPIGTPRDETGTQPAAEEAEAEPAAAAGSRPETEPRPEITGSAGTAAPAEPGATKPSPDFPVASVQVGEPDSRNERVERIFFKRHHYAIYQAGGRVIIQFADDPAAADAQIDGIAALFPLRDRLNYLTSDLKRPGDYQEQIANAFRLALEGQPGTAEELLAGAIRTATEQRARIGRLGYLVAAGALSFTLAVILIAVGGLLTGDEDTQPAGLLTLSAGGGALGALLSIALAIRNRTVAPDSHWTTNFVDGTVRVVIGVLSAGALQLLLTSGFIGGVSAGGAAITAEAISWQTALLVGFAAGFLERLVPDLLERKEPLKETVAEKVGTTEPG